jgi:hypothetical protein
MSGVSTAYLSNQHRAPTQVVDPYSYAPTLNERRMAMGPGTRNINDDKFKNNYYKSHSPKNLQAGRARKVGQYPSALSRELNGGVLNNDLSACDPSMFTRTRRLESQDLHSNSHGALPPSHSSSKRLLPGVFPTAAHNPIITILDNKS